jgi:hypothetical protein
MFPTVLFSEVIQIDHYYRDPSEDSALISISKNRVLDGEFEVKEINSLIDSYKSFGNQIYIDISLDDFSSFKKGLSLINLFKIKQIRYSVRFSLKGEKVNCLSVSRLFLDHELLQSGGEIKLQEKGKPLLLDKDFSLLKKSGFIYKIDSLEIKKPKGRKLFFNTLKKFNKFDDSGNRVFLYNLCFL